MLGAIVVESHFPGWNLEANGNPNYRGRILNVPIDWQAAEAMDKNNRLKAAAFRKCFPFHVIRQA